MPAPAKNIANNTPHQYSVKWKTETIGFTQTVDPSGLKPKMVDQPIGELNGIIVDTWIRGGLEGTVKMTLHETVIERLRQLMPWAAATGGVPILPGAVNFSAYANSGPLEIHRVGAPDAADDITILHAFPMCTLPKEAGANFQTVDVEWKCFPDRAALVDEADPAVVYGYVGVVPA